MITKGHNTLQMNVAEFRATSRELGKQFGAKTITFKRIRLYKEGIVKATIRGANGEHINTFSFFPRTQTAHFII